MLEGIEVELGAERLVEDREDVLVELGRDPGRVVVGGLQPPAILHQVGAEQEVVLLAQEVRHPGEEAGALRGLEVPDRAAEQREHARSGERDPLQVALEVAHQPVDRDPVLGGDRRGGVAGDALRDVHRRVGLEAPGVAHRIEQHPGLERRARAELDQGRRAAGPGADLARVESQDLPLGPGRVVLRHLGDPLEELRAALVVEVAGRELLERLREAGPHVGRHP